MALTEADRTSPNGDTVPPATPTTQVVTNTDGWPVAVRMSGTPRLTPNELRLLKAVTGRALQEVMGDEADAMQAMVWLRLRRAGYVVTWEQAGDVEADLSEDEPDPTSGGPSPRSPVSAATGE